MDAVHPLCHGPIDGPSVAVLRSDAQCVGPLRRLSDVEAYPETWMDSDEGCPVQLEPGGT